MDARGNVYIVDRQGAGLNILQLTGAARQVADFTKQAESEAGPDPHDYRTVGGH